MQRYAFSKSNDAVDPTEDEGTLTEFRFTERGTAEYKNELLMFKYTIVNSIWIVDALEKISIQTRFRIFLQEP